jgi:hypothetical protein
VAQHFFHSQVAKSHPASQLNQRAQGSRLPTRVGCVTRHVPSLALPYLSSNPSPESKSKALSQMGIRTLGGRMAVCVRPGDRMQNQSRAHCRAPAGHESSGASGRAGRHQRQQSDPTLHRRSMDRALQAQQPGHWQHRSHKRQAGN